MPCGGTQEEVTGMSGELFDPGQSLYGCKNKGGHYDCEMTLHATFERTAVGKAGNGAYSRPKLQFLSKLQLTSWLSSLSVADVGVTCPLVSPSAENSSNPMQSQ